MTDRSGSKRRDFLKGSLVLGASGMAAPVLAQSAPTKPVRSSQATGPTATAAHAEAGPVGAEPDDVNDHRPRTPEFIEHPGSDYMVDLLRAAGITYVSAMAGSSFRGLHESLVNYGGNKAPELIACPHEEVSAAMCHGYAKVAGKPMACMVHSTVGLQHASMAIYNAYCDRVPMVILAANTLDETKRRPGVEWLHTAEDLGAFVRDFIKWEDTPASLPHFGESFMRAMQLAMTPPYEPVLLVMDTELQEDEIPDRASLKIPRMMRVAPPGGDPAALAAAAEMLIAADQPLIAADRAARTPEGLKQVVRLAELLNAPVVDKGGRMNMPTNHPLNHTGRTSALVRRADVIIGLELTDIWGLVNNVPDTIERKAVRIARDDAKIIGISATYAMPHSNIQDQQRYYACDIAMAADAEATVPQLIEAIEARLTPAHRARIAARRPALEQEFKRMRAADATAAAVGWDASPVSTARLSMELWQRIKHLDWGLTTDSKFISAWPQRLWDMTEHHQYIGGEGGYGLGYGLPASLGAALAHRDAGRIAVAVQTDGDIMMLPNTFWTMAHHEIPLLMVMHNNRAWHQETMHLKRMSSRRNRGPTSWTNGTVITDPLVDFAGLARSLGVWAEGPIDNPAKLGPALDRALAVVRGGKPALIDVVTQPR